MADHPVQLRSVERKHILAVIVEDYCHVGSISGVVPVRYWQRFESRVERNTLLALDLLDEAGAKATFFVVGWIADHQPEVVAEIVRRGHEVASKGYSYRSIDQLSHDEFRDDVLRSKLALESVSGQPVRGYRFPRSGLGRKDFWVLDTLIDLGFTYDSSLRPIGFEFASEPHRRFVHRHRSERGEIWEVPLSTWKLGPLCIPVSGGNYVRQLPGAFIKRALANWDRRVDAPFVFHFHVWELDPGQPRITAAPTLHRLRQYRNLEHMPERIHYYLSNYRYGTIAQHLNLPPVEPCAPAARTAPVVPSSAPDVRCRVRLSPRTPITVVVPCYNEETTLGYLSNTLRSFEEAAGDEFEISYLFVDDGSKDGTWARLGELFGDRPDCRLIRHARNRGVAAATLTGVHNAQTDVVCVIDCDTTYDPMQLRNMVPLMSAEVDLVTASPYHAGGKVLNLPAWRLFLSRAASTLYSFVLRHKLATYTSCFRVYRRRAMDGIRLRNEGYVGIVEILCQLDQRGSKIVECPAVMEVRLLGNSKMKTLRTIRGHLKLLAEVVADRWFPNLEAPKHPIGKESYRD